MRVDEAFILGAMTGAVVVWLWGKKIEDGIGAKARGVRTKAADGIQAVEERMRPARGTKVKQRAGPRRLAALSRQ